MYDLDSIKLPKNMNKILIGVKLSKDDTWYGCMVLPKNRWKKRYTALYDGLCKDDEDYILMAFSTSGDDESLAAFNVNEIIFKDEIKHKQATNQD